MARARTLRWAASAVAVAGALAARPLFADAPPWTDPGDVPLPTWARSVTPTKPEVAIYAGPGTLDRRGSVQPGAHLPLFATRRAAGCPGRWFNVGPLAWLCSDVVELAPDEPWSPPLGASPWLGGEGAAGEEHARPPRPGARTSLPPLAPLSSSDDGLPYRYFFAGRDGAFGYPNLATALEDAADQELEPGFAVAAVEERTAHGERWVRTTKGRWIAARELAPARSSLFRGELVAGALDFAWIVADRAAVYPSERADRSSGIRARFEKVMIYEERPGKAGAMLRVSADAETPAWIRARDASRPTLAPPPPELEGPAERWIDVDLGAQALVAYEGAQPVFATLVSTGSGGPRSDRETRRGTFRIWVKVFTSKMDNLERDDATRRYAIEEVPWVQFFDKGIGLHAAFWHHGFGRVRSHGCVNLAPLDARWLFAFTAPHLPAGWTAALPTDMQRGTVVRVR